MITRLEVRNGIAVAGRGAVLIAYVLEGRPRAGQRTPAVDLGMGLTRALELVAVQKLASPDTGRSAVGLVFRDAPSLQVLQRIFPSGSIVTLQDSAAGRSEAE